MAANSRVRTRGLVVAGTVIVLATVTACAADQGVSSIAAQPLPNPAVDTTLPTASVPAEATEPGSTEPRPTEPPSTTPVTR